MLYTAKEIIEDERNKIKNGINTELYNTQKTINNFKVKTSVSKTRYYNCYDLKVSISDENREMELNTYVTKKE